MRTNLFEEVISMNRWIKSMYSFFAALLILSNVTTGISLAAPVSDTTPDINSAVSDLSPYVEVYYDKTYKSDRNTFTADSNNYQMTYDLSAGGATAMKIRQGDFPEANLFAAASLTPAIKV